MLDTVTAEWVAVDWGTSHLRAWAMQGGTALTAAQSDDGMARLAGGDFEAALLRLIGGWLDAAPTTVIACGMVGARQGWIEAPYQPVPVKPLEAAPVRVPGCAAGLHAYVIPGLKQDSPADVMRGEETQIAGYLALNPNWDGVICLPGTHTKWAQVSAGEVVSFQTFMTGELFALIGRQSVLRHTVGSDGWDTDAFAAAMDDAMAKPERLAARLFALRAEDLLRGLSPQAARARLSGLLIGAELAAARPYWLGQNLAVIGAAETARAYVSALELQGAPAILADAARMTLAGLTAARRGLRDPA